MKPGVPQAELPGVAIDQIQADGEDDVDTDIDDDTDVVAVELRAKHRHHRCQHDASDQPALRAREE